jgi:hypothetical protein
MPERGIEEVTTMPETSDAAERSDASLSELLVGTIVALYQRVHQELRDALQHVDGQTLTWVPAPDTNSISILVVHLLGSEADMLRSVRGLPSDRDRDAEFAQRVATREELLNLVDAADGDLDRLGLEARVQDLRALRLRPNHPAAESGLYWLLRNYGHAREHLAHLQLTKQLYDLAQPHAGDSHK